MNICFRIVDAPRRLQTALGLYSNDLCGLVVMTDSPPPHYTGLAKRMTTTCQQSTEFHFPQMEDQLEKIMNEVKEPVRFYYTMFSFECSNRRFVTGDIKKCSTHQKFCRTRFAGRWRFSTEVKRKQKLTNGRYLCYETFEFSRSSCFISSHRRRIVFKI
jgi:hypothetical protein